MNPGICTTRGMAFEPSAAARQRAEAQSETRRRRDEEERAYREHLPQQIRRMRRDQRKQEA